MWNMLSHTAMLIESLFTQKHWWKKNVAGLMDEGKKLFSQVAAIKCNSCFFSTDFDLRL